MEAASTQRKNLVRSLDPRMKLLLVVVISTATMFYSKPRSSSMELYYHHSALADFGGGPACYKVCPYIRDGFSGGICLSLDTK